MLGLSPLLFGGTAEQVGRWMPQFLDRSGAPLAAFGFSEPTGSANFASSAPGTGVTTTVRREGEELVINGRKAWVSNAAGWDNRGADITTVVCRTDSSLSPANAVAVVIVPGGTAGIVCEEPIDSLGHRAHLLPRVRYDNVRVPMDNLIGQPGDGVALSEQSFTATAAVVGAFAVGVMREAFDTVLTFAKSEKRGGPSPILDYQAVGYALADAKMKIEAVRAMTWRACFALDTEEPGAKELSLQTKVFGAETAVEVVSKLMQVMGVSSYDHEHRIAALLQDASAFPLFDGGNLGVRRRQLHELMQAEDYDPLTAAGN
jgi:butyryl-CoA dehydrogenase